MVSGWWSLSSCQEKGSEGYIDRVCVRAFVVTIAVKEKEKENRSEKRDFVCFFY